MFLILRSTFPCSMTTSRRTSPCRQSFAMRAPSLGAAWNGQSPVRMSDCEVPGAPPCGSLLQHDDGLVAACASIETGEGSGEGSGEGPLASVQQLVALLSRLFAWLARGM